MSAIEQKPTKTRYLNTLIFAGIALLLTVVFIVAVVTMKERMTPFFPLIATIEIGLILVLIYTLWNVMSNERRVHKLKTNAYNNRLQVDSCPDYWTRDGDKCFNSYRPADDPSTRYEFRNGTRSVDLNHYNNKKLKDACKKMRSTVSAPWTDMRFVCDSYN